MNHTKMLNLTDRSGDEGHDPMVIRIPGTQSCFLRCGILFPFAGHRTFGCTEDVGTQLVASQQGGDRDSIEKAISVRYWFGRPMTRICHAIAMRSLLARPNRSEPFQKASSLAFCFHRKQPAGQDLPGY